MKEQWRKEMTELLIQLTKEELKATPGRLRFLAELFLEIREIMFLDNKHDDYSKEVLRLIKAWMNKADFDLLKEIKDYREMLQRVKK
jgi:hypothetical protein